LFHHSFRRNIRFIIAVSGAFVKQKAAGFREIRGFVFELACF